MALMPARTGSTSPLPSTVEALGREPLWMGAALEGPVTWGVGDFGGRRLNVLQIGLGTFNTFLQNLAGGGTTMAGCGGFSVPPAWATRSSPALVSSQCPSTWRISGLA